AQDETDVVLPGLLEGVAELGEALERGQLVGEHPGLGAALLEEELAKGGVEPGGHQGLEGVALREARADKHPGAAPAPPAVGDPAVEGEPGPAVVGGE